MLLPTGVNVGAFGVSTSSHSQQTPPQRFHRSRFLHGPEITVQQFQSLPMSEPKESAKNRVYVQPQWVAGGYGVEVLEPGHWVDTDKDAH
jgi:hypothetical protein